jgi:hypothetical protein
VSALTEIIDILTESRIKLDALGWKQGLRKAKIVGLPDIQRPYARRLQRYSYAGLSLAGALGTTPSSGPVLNKIDALLTGQSFGL